MTVVEIDFSYGFLQMISYRQQFFIPYQGALANNVQKGLKNSGANQ
jgi:hypothetical protein